MKLIITSLMLVFVFSISIISSSAVVVPVGITLQEATSYINAFEEGDITYSVVSMKPLKSVSNPSGYEYVLCELNPYGYAIMTLDGLIMEGGFSEDAEIPLSTLSTGDYYYVGVSSFAQIQDGSLVLVNSDVVMSNEQIQRVMETEVWVKSRGGEMK